MNPRIPLVAASLALLAHAPLAVAQQPSTALAATRRDLIDQARAARSSNDHARALDLAQRAGQIEMSVSLRRFIGEEQESLGRVAEAMNTAETCVREGGGSRDNAAHVEACRALSARLQPRVGRLSIVAPSPAPAGLRVRVAGTEVPAAVWGVPMLVTPGAVTVDAEAPSFRPYHREVSVAVGAVASVPIELDALPPPPPAPIAVAAPPPPAAVVAPAPAVVTAPAAPAPSSGGPGAGPIVLMGAGALALGGAVTFLALSYGDAGEPCPDDPSLTCVSSRASTFSTLGWVSLGVGVSAVVGGIVWFVVGRNSASHGAPRATLTGAPLPGGGTLGLRMTF